MDLNCPDCDVAYKQSCPRQKKGHRSLRQTPCFGCLDGCRKHPLQNRCLRCARKVVAANREDTRAYLSRAEKAELHDRLMVDNKLPVECDGLSLVDIGRVGVRMAIENGDESEAVILGDRQLVWLMNHKHLMWLARWARVFAERRAE